MKRILQQLTYTIRRIRVFLSSRYMRLLGYLPFVFIGITILLCIAVYGMLPSLIPLYYTRPYGVDQLAPKLHLLLLPFGALFWHLVSLFYASRLEPLYRVFAQLLISVSFSISIVVLFITITIFRLVF